MATPTQSPATPLTSREQVASTLKIISYTCFTFVVYLAIGLPLAVLPPHVHLRMGFSAAFAGMVIGIQYIATFISRPWAGHISDRAGAKVAVLWGMGMCAASGALLLAAGLLHGLPHASIWPGMAALILSRLALGVGESLGSTGSTLWGISAVGHQHTARVIGFNGVSTYGAIALGAPLGVLMDARWGFGSIGLLTMAVCLISLAIAAAKHPVPIQHGEALPFTAVLGRVAPHGIGLALSGVGYSVLATFVTLYYASRHWEGAAACLTAFGVAFILVRIIFIHAIPRFGGWPVAIVCLIVESAGTLLMWLAPGPHIAMLAAAITGCGVSLVFPALGVEAVKHVPLTSRGAALGVYTGFSDVSFFLVGPVAGAVIGAFGYGSAFLFALISVALSLVLTLVLSRMDSRAA